MYSVLDLDIDRLCSFVWWFFTKEAEQTEKDKFRARLWRPDTKKAKAKPIPKNSPWSAESEMSAFAALKAETGQGRSTMPKRAPDRRPPRNAR